MGNKFDYNRDTAYVVGGGAKTPYENGLGEPLYNPQVYTQAQLNNNMSGTDANAIYQATHDQNFAPQYNQPYMQNYLADLARMGLTNYNGQQVPVDNAGYGYDAPGGAGAYVTGAGAFMMPSSYGEEQVLPQGYGSWDGLTSRRDLPNGDQRAKYYADVLRALTINNASTPNNRNAILRESINAPGE